MSIASFTTDRKQFRAALNRISTTIKRSPKPVLENARLSINGTVEISGTDTEQSQTEALPTMLKRGNAETVIDFKTLKTTIGASSAELVTVEALENGALKIDGGAMIQPGFQNDELPTVNHFESSGASTRSVVGRWFGSAAVFAELVNSTIYAIDSESCRYALSAIELELSQYDENGQPSDYLRMTATDGRRLTTAAVGSDTRITSTALFAGSFAKAAAKAAKAKRAAFVLVQVIEDTTAAVESEFENVDDKPETKTELIQVFTFDSSKAVVSMFSFRLVDGRFPKWRDILPSSLEKTENQVAEVSAKALAELVNQAKAARIAEAPSIDLRFRETDRRSTTGIFAIVRNASTRFCNSCRAELRRRAKTCVNADFLSDFLKPIGKTPQAVAVGFADSESAVSLDYSTRVDGEALTVEAVIMPLSRNAKPKRQTPAELREAEAEATPTVAEQAAAEAAAA